MSWFQRHHKLLGIVAALVALNTFLFLLGPENIVASIGVHNAYLVVFVIAAIGGMSAFTGATYVSAIVTFAAGGANPWLIGLFGGLGVFISDSAFYLLAEYGHQAVPEEWRLTLQRVTGRVRKLPHALVMILTYIYHGLLPLPSDLMMLALVLGGYHYRKIAPVIFLAALTYSTLIAHFGSLWF